MGRLMNSKVLFIMLLTQVGKKDDALDAHSLSSIRFIRVPVSRCWKMAACNTVTPYFLLGYAAILPKLFPLAVESS